VAVEAEHADDLAFDQERDPRPGADELGPFLSREPLVDGDVGQGQGRAAVAQRVVEELAMVQMEAPYSYRRM